MSPAAAAASRVAHAAAAEVIDVPAAYRGRPTSSSAAAAAAAAPGSEATGARAAEVFGQAEVAVRGSLGLVHISGSWVGLSGGEALTADATAAALHGILPAIEEGRLCVR